MRRRRSRKSVLKPAVASASHPCANSSDSVSSAAVSSLAAGGSIRLRKNADQTSATAVATKATWMVETGQDQSGNGRACEEADAFDRTRSHVRAGQLARGAGKHRQQGRCRRRERNTRECVCSRHDVDEIRREIGPDERRAGHDQRGPQEVARDHQAHPRVPVCEHPAQRAQQTARDRA